MPTYIYIYISEKSLERMKYTKILVGVLAFVMVISSTVILTGNSGNKTVSVEFGKNGSLSYLMGRYDLYQVNQVSNTTKFGNVAPLLVGINMSHKELTTTWTILNSSSNDSHGYVVTIAVGGHAIHQTLVIGAANETSIIPIYSTTGNYNITHITSNLTGNHSRKVSTDVKFVLKEYTLVNNGIGFNQGSTVTLEGLLAIGAGVTAYETAGLAALILIFGVATIRWYDNMGGDHGVYFGNQMIWFIPVYWINAPFNPNSPGVLGCSIISGCVP